MKVTYVGSGDSPPLTTNFMGRQMFTLNKTEIVTDPELQAKLRGHPCFRVQEEDINTADFIEVSNGENNPANRKRGRPKTRQVADRSEFEIGVERGSDPGV